MPAGIRNAGILGGGSGAVVPKMFFRAHIPRRTGDVRLDCDVSVSTLPCPRSPARSLPGSVTGRNSFPKHLEFRSAEPAVHSETNSSQSTNPARHGPREVGWPGRVWFRISSPETISDRTAGNLAGSGLLFARSSNERFEEVVTRSIDFGSRSMRFTCRSRTAGSCSCLVAHLRETGRPELRPK